jgi:hypothetical protein
LTPYLSPKLSHPLHNLDAILYENVNDAGTRDHLRASPGCCGEHAWRLPNNSGSALGMAILYQDLLTAMERSLEAARLETIALGAILKALGRSDVGVAGVR